MKLKTLITAGLAAALVALPASTGTAAAAPANPPSITGQGSGTLPGNLFPQWADNPISFTIDAQAAPDPSDPNHADGIFQVTHLRTDGSLYTEFSGTVTSLTTAGQMAVVNGLITAADDPANPGLNLIGAHIALTFDNRPDGARVGFVWGFAGQPVAEAQGAVPFLKLANSSVVVNSNQPGPFSTRTLPDQPGPIPARQLSGTVTGSDPITGGYYTLTTNAEVAAGAAPTTAQGTFTYTLYQPEIAKSTSYSGTISCLNVGGEEAVATGRITTATNNPTLIGKQAAWSIYDNGADTWITGILDATSTPVHACQGPLPLQPETGGHITVEG